MTKLKQKDVANKSKSKCNINMTKLKQKDVAGIPPNLLLKRDPNYFISDMNFSYSASTAKNMTKLKKIDFFVIIAQYKYMLSVVTILKFTIC